MAQSKPIIQLLREVVQHYDLGDLCQYLIQRKVLSALDSEVISKIDSKERFVTFMAGTHIHKDFLSSVLIEYAQFVHKEVLAGSSKPSVRDKLSFNDAEFESGDSVSSSSSFSEDSDLNYPLSQEIPSSMVCLIII